MTHLAAALLAIAAITTWSSPATAQTAPERMTRSALRRAIRTPESFAALIDPALGYAFVERMSGEGPQLSRSRRVCAATLTADTVRLRQQLRTTISRQSDGDPFSCRNLADGTTTECSIGIGGEFMATYDLYFVAGANGSPRLDGVALRNSVYYEPPQRRYVARELARQRAAVCSGAAASPPGSQASPPTASGWISSTTAEFPWHTLVFRRQIRTGFCSQNLGIADDGTIWRERGCEAHSQSQRGRTISSRELAAIRAAFAALPTTEPTCRSDPGGRLAGELSFVERTVAGGDYASSRFKTWPVCAATGAYAPVDAGVTGTTGPLADLERLFAALE